MGPLLQIQQVPWLLLPLGRKFPWQKRGLYNEGDIVKTSNWQADQMLCYGRLCFDASASLEDGINASDAQLALASTGTEAVSTYLSKQMKKEDGSAFSEDEQLRIENQLEAVILSDAVRGKNVDFINRLKSDRHKQGFSQVDGGSLWAFIEESKIDIGQQSLIPNSYNATSKTLHIAGKKWMLTMATGHENALNDHVPTVTYSLSGEDTPTATINANRLEVRLGNINSPTTVDS